MKAPLQKAPSAKDQAQTPKAFGAEKLQASGSSKPQNPNPSPVGRVLLGALSLMFPWSLDVGAWRLDVGSWRLEDPT